MNRWKDLLMWLPLVLLISSTTALASPTYIGKITKVTETASILRGVQVIPVQQNSDVYVNDTLSTGTNGSVAVTFRDGTIITLGPASEFHLSEYVFKPLDRSSSFTGSIKRGSISYISGAIGRMNPDSVKIKTPTAYLGLRGTKVLVQVD